MLKCVFEYMDPGSCKNGSTCSFSHIFSSEERNDSELRKKMNSRWTWVVKKKNDRNLEIKPETKPTLIKESVDESEMKEFKGLMSKLKDFLACVRYP